MGNFLFFLFYVRGRHIFCWCQIIYNIVVMTAVGEGLPGNFCLWPRQTLDLKLHIPTTKYRMLCSDWQRSSNIMFSLIHLSSMFCWWTAGPLSTVSPGEARWSLCMGNTGSDSCSYRNQLWGRLISCAVPNVRVDVVNQSSHLKYDNSDHEGLLICVLSELTAAFRRLTGEITSRECSGRKG